MTAKTDRLARELASLFVKYSLADWRPLIDELRRSGSYRPLADGIEQLTQVKVKQATKVRTRSKKKGASIPSAGQYGPIAEELQPLRAALVSKRILHSPSELRMAAEAAGMKADLPSDRPEAIRRLLAHLESLSGPVRNSALSKMAEIGRQSKTDQGLEFERWAALIMRSKGDR